MAGLMDMPRETRYQILELCLLVEGAINPYPAHHEDQNQFPKRSRKPDIALLKVNKVLNLEATDIFYKMNTWQLSSPRPLDYPPSEEDIIWKFHSGRISHLHIVMNMHDHPPDTVLTAVKKADENSLTDDYRRTFIHERCFRAALETWNWKMAVMSDIVPSTLEIDMEDMYCPLGCCRGEFIDLWGRVMRGVVCVSDGPRGHWLSTGQLLTTHRMTDISLVGLGKGEERYLRREILSRDSEGEANGEPLDAALRFSTQWRAKSSNRR